MSGAALAIAPLPEESEAEDSAKRLQILEGARRCFLAQGFDGTSMNDIVRAAGVSKGTVYAYFPSKEKLFEAMVFHDRRSQAERTVVLGDLQRPMDVVLTELGLRMAALFSSPEQLSWVRTIVGVAAKFPDVGRSFYEAGPAYAINRIAEYLEQKMADGTIRPVNARLAAMQYVELVQCGQVKPKLFSSESAAGALPLEETVKAGVALFLGGLRRG